MPVGISRVSVQIGNVCRCAASRRHPATPSGRCESCSTLSRNLRRRAQRGNHVREGETSRTQLLRPDFDAAPGRCRRPPTRPPRPRGSPRARERARRPVRFAAPASCGSDPPARIETPSRCWTPRARPASGRCCGSLGRRLVRTLDDGVPAALQIAGRLEHDGDIGHAGHRGSAHRGRAGDALERLGQHLGRAARDLDCRMPHPVGHQHDLRIRQIRNRIARQRPPGQLSGRGQHERHGNHDPVVAGTPRHHAGNHCIAPAVASRCACRRRSASQENALSTTIGSPSRKPESTTARPRETVPISDAPRAECPPVRTRREHVGALGGVQHRARGNDQQHARTGGKLHPSHLARCKPRAAREHRSGSGLATWSRPKASAARPSGAHRSLRPAPLPERRKRARRAKARRARSLRSTAVTRPLASSQAAARALSTKVRASAAPMTRAPADGTVNTGLAAGSPPAASSCPRAPWCACACSSEAAAASLRCRRKGEGPHGCGADQQQQNQPPGDNERGRRSRRIEVPCGLRHG